MALSLGYKEGFVGGFFAGMVVVVLLFVVIAYWVGASYVPPGGVLT